MSRDQSVIWSYGAVEKQNCWLNFILLTVMWDGHRINLTLEASEMKIIEFANSVDPADRAPDKKGCQR